MACTIDDSIKDLMELFMVLQAMPENKKQKEKLTSCAGALAQVSILFGSMWSKLELPELEEE